MKKLIAFSIMTVAAVAFAHTIGVPFFLDIGPDNGEAYPAPGSDRVANTRTFIGVKNYTNEAKELTINYYTGAGAEAGSGTATLAANQGVGWRPFGDDAGAEGDGVNFPNATTGAGSATILYMGEEGDVGGRVITTEPGGQSAYLIV